MLCQARTARLPVIRYPRALGPRRDLTPCAIERSEDEAQPNARHPLRRHDRSQSNLDGPRAPLAAATEHVQRSESLPAQGF